MFALDKTGVSDIKQIMTILKNINFYFKKPTINLWIIFIFSLSVTCYVFNSEMYPDVPKYIFWLDKWTCLCWSDTVDLLEPCPCYNPGVMRSDIAGAYASQRSKCILSDLHTECRNPCRALSPCHTFLLFSKDQEPQAYVKHLVVLSQSVRDFQQRVAILAHVQLKCNVVQHARAQRLCLRI